MRVTTLTPIGVLLLVTACTYVPPVEHIPLSNKNPTTYVFSAPYASVLNAIDEVCRKNRLASDYDTPTSREIRGCNRWSESEAKSRGRPAQFYYTPKYRPDAQKDEISIFTKHFDSRSYYVHGRPLQVGVHMRVDLLRSGEQKTKVTVTAVDLEAFNGTIPAMHGGIARHVEHLPRTTIEEYEILLYLGRLLGEADMPPVRVP